MVEDGIFGYNLAKIISVPIVLNGHYHLLVLDKVKMKYIHYSFLQLHTYDINARDMVHTPDRFIRFIISLDMR